MSTIDDLTEQEQRLIAADFAERVLPIFEAQYPDDDRPRKSIEEARAYARGEITKEQLSAATKRRRLKWPRCTTRTGAAARSNLCKKCTGSKQKTWAAERAWQQQRIDEVVAARAKR